jgi:hypothetical protein
MRTARKLVVKKETLGELTSAELGSVVGGDTTGIISKVINCITLSNMIQPCPTQTNPVCDRVSAAIRPCPSRDIAC